MPRDGFKLMSTKTIALHYCFCRALMRNSLTLKGLRIEPSPLASTDRALQSLTIYLVQK